MKQLTWQDLEKFHKTLVNDRIVYRTNQVIYDYSSNLKNLSRLLSYDEYLSKKLFLDSTELYQYLPNKYPYNLAPGIKHMVLWINPILHSFDPNDFDLVEKIIDIIGKNKKFLFYRNGIATSSINDIIHYQVFELEKN